MPNIPQLSFSTLSSGTISRENPLIVNWIKDSGYLLPSYIVIQGRNDYDVVKSDLLIKETNDVLGSYTIYPEELSKFKAFERITVYYFKAYQTDIQISGKKNMITVLNMSYSNLYFE